MRRTERRERGEGCSSGGEEGADEEEAEQEEAEQEEREKERKREKFSQLFYQREQLTTGSESIIRLA